jgi:hypothetical protein
MLFAKPSPCLGAAADSKIGGLYLSALQRSEWVLMAAPPGAPMLLMQQYILSGPAVGRHWHSTVLALQQQQQQQQQQLLCAEPVHFSGVAARTL